MLLRFKISNYRSFREEIVLDMEAASFNEYKECLLEYKKDNYLPNVAIYGKNGGGKSNLIRSFWLAVQFITNAQRTQHETAEIPVRPFELDDYSKDNPTFFEFEYVYKNKKYIYGFQATKKEVVKEYLYSYPKGQKVNVFERNYQEYHFVSNSEKKMKELIKGAVAGNQLFFAIACTMNYAPCIEAMGWFRNQIFFARDFVDIGKSLLSNREDSEMLKTIVSVAKIADIGICDMKFEINNLEISDLGELPEDIGEDVKLQIKKAFSNFKQALESGPNEAEGKLQYSEVKATSFHSGVTKSGEGKEFSMGLSDESDGTRKLMALYPAIENALRVGGVVLVDEIEKELHPLLVEYLIGLFQGEKNQHGAQMIFTTHSTEIMGRELLRRDQIYFVDKNKKTGVSELYSLADFSPRKDENIYKSYILGKYGAIPHIMEE